MPSRPAPLPPGQEAPDHERNTVLLLVVGTLLALSVVIAGLVVLSGGREPAAPAPAPPPVAVEPQSVVVGRADAPSTVVVHEDLGSPRSREFEIASRDFLRIQAGRGAVRVRYLPFAATDQGYGAEALEAWAGALERGTPEQALAFHDVLFDRQPVPPDSGQREFLAWAAEVGIEDPDVLEAIGASDPAFVASAARAAAAAGVREAPVVLLDGQRIEGATPTATAERLQRALLARD